MTIVRRICSKSSPSVSRADAVSNSWYADCLSKRGSTVPAILAPSDTLVNDTPGRRVTARDSLDNEGTTMKVNIRGSVDEPKRTATDDVYRGRLTLPGVQWTGIGQELFVAVTVTIQPGSDA